MAITSRGQGRWWTEAEKLGEIEKAGVQKQSLHSDTAQERLVKPITPACPLNGNCPLQRDRVIPLFIPMHKITVAFMV